jgi:N-hydroxyarylamine O-acetyltransferase
MQLDAYLQRIGFAGEARPTLETLRALHRRHVLSVSFENVDVQLHRPLSIDVEAAYEKIVTRRRGGWCYEQNGLFGWALSEIGLGVTRVAAAGNRAARGDAAEANHLTLLVDIPGADDGPWLADVGFGGSMLEPIPLRESTHRHAPYRVGLRRLDNERWEFHEHDGSAESCFDFAARAGNEQTLARKCRALQSDPDSTFVTTLVVQGRTPETHAALRGIVLRRLTPAQAIERTLESADDLIATLSEVFDLNIPEAADLWPRLLERHRARLAAKPEH